VGRAEQALLLPGDGGEHQGAGELAGGEHPDDSRSIARRAGSGAWRLSAGLVSARAVPLSRGAATAVTAEADRNARRVEPARLRTSLFSIPQIMAASRQMSTTSRLLPTAAPVLGRGGLPGPFGIVGERPAGAGRRGPRGQRDLRSPSANNLWNKPHIRTYVGVTVQKVLLDNKVMVWSRRGVPAAAGWNVGRGSGWRISRADGQAPPSVPLSIYLV
jgi:hypothetical protein